MQTFITNTRALFAASASGGGTTQSAYVRGALDGRECRDVFNGLSWKRSLAYVRGAFDGRECRDVLRGTQRSLSWKLPNRRTALILAKKKIRFAQGCAPTKNLRSTTQRFENRAFRGRVAKTGMVGPRSPDNIPLNLHNAYDKRSSGSILKPSRCVGLY